MERLGQTQNLRRGFERELEKKKRTFVSQKKNNPPKKEATTISPQIVRLSYQKAKLANRF